MVDKKAAFPGPGEYRVRSDKPDGPAFTIMPPLPEPEPDDRPGPGEYDTKPSGWDGPSYSLGGKLEEQRKDSSNFPGPGTPTAVGHRCKFDYCAGIITFFSKSATRSCTS
jgi:hypothetical protein